MVFLLLASLCSAIHFSAAASEYLCMFTCVLTYSYSEILRSFTHVPYPCILPILTPPLLCNPRPRFAGPNCPAVLALQTSLWTVSWRWWARPMACCSSSPPLTFQSCARRGTGARPCRWLGKGCHQSSVAWSYVFEGFFVLFCCFFNNKKRKRNKNARDARL